MDRVDPALLARMPLAEAVLVAWRHAADEGHLDAVFERHRGRCYQRLIAFPDLVQLVADALLEHRGSGRQGFARGRESGRLAASTRAAYGKLGRMPVALSVAWFAAMADRLRELLPPAAGGPAGHRVVILDGKTVKRLPRRLKPLRSAAGGVTGGKVLVALEHATGLAVALAADPDGDANDTRLVPELLPVARRRLDGPRLWLADRQFCDLIQMGRFAEEDDAFLLRYNAKLSFHPDPTRPPTRGQDDRGRPITEELGLLGRPGHEHRRAARRITLHRDGEEDVAVVTNLMDAEAHPAAGLLGLYLERWGIERVFQQVTEVFALERLIGGTPEATIFQFALCLMLYDLIQLIRSAVARHRGMPREHVSTEQLFVDVRRELIAWSVVLGSGAAAACAPPRSAIAVRERLDELLRRAWSDRWIKAINKRPRGHPARRAKRTHISAYRALKAAGRL